MGTGWFPALLGQPVGLHLSPLCPSLASLVKRFAFNRALVDCSGFVLAIERVIRRSFVPASR